MEKYLTTYLRVPRDRIQLLLGSKEHTSVDNPMYPSRAHIISMLTGLITEDKIVNGDNIIIYYAGHGVAYDNGDLDFVEALCPIDHDAVVTDISDREFNCILTEISRAKGHRITVILDCCHSNSISRELPTPGARTIPRTKCATAFHNMLLAGEQTMKSYPKYRPGSILATDWDADMDSHVFIAACEDHQLAYEEEITNEDGTVVEHVGIFTNSFVRALQSGYFNEGSTYEGIINALDFSPRQTPYVAGTRKDTRIWYQD